MECFVSKFVTFLCKNGILLLLIAFIIKLIAFPVGIGEALALFALSACFCYLEYLNNANKTWVKDQEAWKISIFNEISELKTKITAMKINQGIKVVHEPKSDKRFF